jgi:hypothetical protein
MSFYGKRVYYRLQHVKSHPVILQIDRGNARYFTGFQNMRNFIVWYKNVPEKERTFNEVIVSDMRKLIIDIDDPDELELRNMLAFYDIERHVTARIRQVLQEFYITAEILVYNMSNDEHISFHFIVSNVAFKAKTCYGLCELICANQVWEPLVDKGVYKRIQMMRIEGSTKYGQQRHKPFVDINKSFIGNVSIILHHDLDITVSPQQAVSIIRRANEQAVSIIRRANERAVSISIIRKEGGGQLQATGNTPFRWPAPFTDRPIGQFIPAHFKIRKITHNAVFLDRIRPAMCMQCTRVHTSENAVILLPCGKNILPFWLASLVGPPPLGTPVFICWRLYAQNVYLRFLPKTLL